MNKSTSTTINDNKTKGIECKVWSSIEGKTYIEKETFLKRLWKKILKRIKEL